MSKGGLFLLFQLEGSVGTASKKQSLTIISTGSALPRECRGLFRLFVKLATIRDLVHGSISTYFGSKIKLNDFRSVPMLSPITSSQIYQLGAT